MLDDVFAMMVRLIFGLGNVFDVNGKISYNYHNLGAIYGLNTVEKHDFKIALKDKGFTLYRHNDIYILLGHEGMNNSGLTLNRVLQLIEVNEIFVVHDEIDIIRGRVIVRKSSSRSTHNGLRNIFSMVSKPIMQVRIGVGPCDTDVCTFVLKDIKKTEKPCFDAVIKFLSTYLLHEKVDMKDLFVNYEVEPFLVTSFKEYKKHQL